MDRPKLLLLPIVILPFFLLTSCKDRPTPTEPAVTPSLAMSSSPEVDAGRIRDLLVALYPGPGLEVAALARWENVQRLTALGEQGAAQAQMRLLATQVTDLAADGRLDTPDDPLLPPTVEAAVSELVTRLFVFVGLEVSEALEEYSEALPEDFGFGELDPDEPDTVVTSSGWAAVVSVPGATDEPVFVTIELLDQQTCETADPLTQARGCWQIDRYPEGDFEEDVKVEICVADNPALSDDEWDLLLLHHKSDDGEVSALPWAEPTVVDCTGFDPTAAQQTAHRGPLGSFFAAVGGGLGELFLPEPLAARLMDTRPPRGIGGTAGTFSSFFAAVPESARPDLVSWWPGDGSYDDMYGENHGAPIGDVHFVAPAISDSGFWFDGDGDAVLIQPLSDEVQDLQQLTLATWVYLDPSGPADAIQRFVTIGDEKAVLRQEEGGDRMLHFYMGFEGGTLPGLHHIRVDHLLQPGCWHFFAGSYDGVRMHAYLDGVEVGTESMLDGSVVVSGDFAKLGASGGPFATGEVMTGGLDEVMIFDRALEAGEIEAIYDAAEGDKCVPALPTPAGAAVAEVSGAFKTWYRGNYDHPSQGMSLTDMAFQHTSPWANWGMEELSRIPRIAVQNDVASPHYTDMAQPWKGTYQALTEVADGLLALEDPDVQAELTADELNRIRAFGKFVQGMGHGTFAALWDEGPILDEDMGPAPPTPHPYAELMDAAVEYFDEAIALASAGSWTLPLEWMRAELTAPELAQVAHSMRARFQAAVARTPAERADVHWAAVMADIDAGISDDLVLDLDWGLDWFSVPLYYGTHPYWTQLGYFIYGMADQSGDFQAWDAIPVADKTPYFGTVEDPVLIVTPDQRFPQGTTVEEQRAAPGSYFRILGTDSVSYTWTRPDRGTWRWSWYKITRGSDYRTMAAFQQPEIRMAEMRLLKAEAMYRSGNYAGAAAIVNETRVAAGLNATDAGGTNTSCVPKLPDGSCGDLWEMLKWEKRMETTFTGLMGASWFWDARAWGDLWKDTALQFPVPCDEMADLGWGPCTTYGGGGPMSAPGSPYGWNGEGT